MGITDDMDVHDDGPSDGPVVSPVVAIFDSLNERIKFIIDELEEDENVVMRYAHEIVDGDELRLQYLLRFLSVKYATQHDLAYGLMFV
jgi:hypothetical protein